jgi:hypothetical protein
MKETLPTKKSLRGLDKYRTIGDGSRLTPEDAKLISEAIAKQKAKRKKKAA